MHPDQDLGGAPQSARPPRRRGKGRHFRPSRRKPTLPRQPSSAAREAPVEVDQPDDAPISHAEAEVEAREAVTEERRQPLPRENAARAPAITRAIEHIEEVIADLKAALEEMELALELVEEAERQKLDDERELKALQKALERVNRFRGGSRSQD